MEILGLWAVQCLVNCHEWRSRGEAIDDDEAHRPGDEGQLARHEQLVARRTVVGPYVMEPRSDLSLALDPGAQRAIPDDYKLEMRNVCGNTVGCFQQEGKPSGFVQAANIDAAACPLRNVYRSQPAC